MPLTDAVTTVISDESSGALPDEVSHSSPQSRAVMPLLRLQRLLQDHSKNLMNETSFFCSNLYYG